MMKAAQQQVSTPSNNGSNGGGNGGGGGPGHMLGGPGGANTPSIASPPPSGGLLGGECYTPCRVCVVIRVEKRKNALHRVMYAKRNTFVGVFFHSHLLTTSPNPVTPPCKHDDNLFWSPFGPHTFVVIIFFQRKFVLSPVVRQPVILPAIEQTRFSDDYYHSPTPPPLPGNAAGADSVRKSFVSHRDPPPHCVAGLVRRRSEHDGYAQTRVGRVS